MSLEKIIYTIGHSTKTFDEFVLLLTSFKVKVLVDIRSSPGSKRYPHFNKENLEQQLPDNKIIYRHFPDLGGRRKALKDSKNTAWKNDAFRGYADYMETDNFKKAINKLEEIASEYTTAYMCSEAVWWRCHRSLVSDYFKWKEWEVRHIKSENKSEEHPYTSPSKVINGKLTYTADQQTLFN